MQNKFSVGQVVKFDTKKPNPWEAFVYSGNLYPVQYQDIDTIIVKIVGFEEDGAVNVVGFSYAYPFFNDLEQFVTPEQLEEIC